MNLIGKTQDELAKTNENDASAFLDEVLVLVGRLAESSLLIFIK